jgi:hypothetical protein
MSHDQCIIKELIEKCYLQGALNAMNIKAMLEGYHEDFAIFFTQGESLQKLVLLDWVRLVENYKSDPKMMESGLRQMDYEIVRVDVTECAASAVIKLFRKNQLIFTDHMSLLKFSTGWKIVSKIYYSHIENPWSPIQ